MKRSQSKQFSINQTNQYPTIKSIASQKNILSLQDLAVRLNNLPLDINSMSMLAFQIKQTVCFTSCSFQQLFYYGIRFMSILYCMSSHFIVNQYYLAKLINCFKGLNQRWKRVFLGHLKQLNQNPDPYQIFIYKINRNNYLLVSLRTSNSMIQKLINKLVIKKQLNQNTINYLRKGHIFLNFQKVYSKMIQILQQKEEETYIKIYLINQFIKFLLLYINFCLNVQEQDQIFFKFFNILNYIFRLIKKFQHPQINNLIEKAFVTIYKGLQLYINNLQKQGNNQIKINQIKHVLAIMQHQTAHQIKDNIFCSKAFLIKLILKILTNWRTVYRKGQKSRQFLLLRSVSDLKLNQDIRKQKQSKLKQNLEAGKIDHIKSQFRKLTKSLVNLQRRKSNYKSQLLKPYIKAGFSLQKNVPKPQQIKIDTLDSSNKSHLRHNNKSLLRCKTNQAKNLREQRSRQLKLEDYQIQKKSILPTVNKIKLYKSQKMSNYCSKKTKLKLDRKT